MGITRSARSSLNPRERLPGVRSRGLSDDLGVYPAISWVTRRSRHPPRPDETPRTRTIVPGEKGSLKNALSGPAHAPRAPPDTALRLAHVEDRAYVMRAQRDRIHPGSRHASSARQNPPRRDSREPTSHNSSSGDMTNSTPPGAPSGRSAAGAAGTGRRPRRRRWGIPAPEGCHASRGSTRPPRNGGSPPPGAAGRGPYPGRHRAEPLPEGHRTGWWPRRRRRGSPAGTAGKHAIGRGQDRRAAARRTTGTKPAVVSSTQSRAKGLAAP